MTLFFYNIYYNVQIWFWTIFTDRVHLTHIVIYMLTAIALILAWLFNYYFLKAAKYKDLYENLNAEAKKNQRLKKLYEEEIKTLANMMDEITFPIWQRDRSMNIIYCNSRFCELTDEIRENVIEKGGIELFRDSKQFAEKALKTGQVQVTEQNIISGSGNILSQVVEIPVSDRNTGSKNGTIGFALSLTELQNTRERLKLNLELQKRLIESLNSAIAIYGKNQKLEYYNHAFVELWKLDEDWLKTAPSYGDILEMLREKRKLPEQADFQSFKRENTKMFSNLINTKEDYYYLNDGRVLKVIIIPYQQQGLLFYYEDMTNRLSLERSYNTLLSVQKYTLDNLNDAVVVFGEDGKLELYNPAFKDMWGFSESFLNSEPHASNMISEMANLYASGTTENFKEDFVAGISSRKVSEQKMNRRDGRILTERFNPLPDGATLITYNDITDKENVERSLSAEKKAYEEANKIKTNFLNNVSYELRSPLTSIMGFSEMLLFGLKAKLEGKTREYIDAIHDSSMKLKNLIDNIIDVSSIDAGYMALNIRKTDIFEIINTAVPQIKEEAEKKDIRINVNVDKQVMTVNADGFRLHQAIQAIFHCGIAMSHEGQEIELKISKVNGKVHFEFIDHGDGISAQDIPLLFDQFYRLQSDGLHSSGLGLYLAKKIIEMHGGTIEVESDKNKGSKFIFEIAE